MTLLSIVISLLLVVLSVLYVVYNHRATLNRSPFNTTPGSTPLSSPPNTSENQGSEKKTIMQPAKDDLAPPKDDPFTIAELVQYDGTDPDKPIYVAIKGTIFDVTPKKDVYGPGRSYHIFAGKDGSKGLGMSSLKPEDAVSDYSGLPQNEIKVLDDWHSFFSKRYNIVGRVVDLPPPAS